MLLIELVSRLEFTLPVNGKNACRSSLILMAPTIEGELDSGAALFLNSRRLRCCKPFCCGQTTLNLLEPNKTTEMLMAFVKCSCSPLMMPTIEGDSYFGTVRCFYYH
jgi:hypothetical protein